MRILDALADLLLGATCPGCDVARWGLCPDCADLITTPPHQVARIQGLPIMAAGEYRPVLSSAIPRYKDDGALHLEGALALRLATAVAALAPPPTAVLVPVPSRPAAVRARGFDHGLRLAQRAAGIAGLSVRRALRRTGTGGDQQGLDARSRRRNLEGVMRGVDPGWPVIIVDDIVTTGASLREARRALRHAGATVLAAAVIADADDR